VIGDGDAVSVARQVSGARPAARRTASERNQIALLAVVFRAQKRLSSNKNETVFS
jgi:hypothetical protein